jgi:DNA-directed RNA polymerase alpha subunit
MTISQLVKRLRAAEAAAKSAADAMEASSRHAVASGMTLRNLGLSVRARNSISRSGVSTVEGLVGLSANDLVANKIGVTSLNEIRERLSEKGLCLRGDESALGFTRESK